MISKILNNFLVDQLHYTLIRKKYIKGKDVLISQAVHMEVRKSNSGILYYKTDFGEDFLEVDFNRKTRRNDCTDISITPIREKPKPISEKKYNHF